MGGKENKDNIIPGLCGVQIKFHSLRILPVYLAMLDYFLKLGLHILARYPSDIAYPVRFTCSVTGCESFYDTSTWKMFYNHFWLLFC